ncbi:ATP-dependent nuclease [Variovorax boronicumulans]|uniref:ATP-dependent nuclease n=1 Tax=Variovorax boronicumulans TaxID=436515 RepID=UPI0009EE2FB4|nr:AAA family ATPase [Variovorax boronicumulans]
MKLKRAKIKNFRSIEDLTIEFNHGCVVLVGINEAGKSNILRALQFLDLSVPITTADLRVERQNEEAVSKGFVEFHFNLEEDEIEAIFKKLANFFYGPCLDAAIVKSADGDLTLREYCSRVSTASHEAWLHTGSRHTLTWSNSDDYSVIPGWFRNDSSFLQIELNVGTVNVPPALVAYSPKNASNANLAHLSIEQLDALVSPLITKRVDAALPKCIFWKYGENYLLPSHVKIAEFSDDPSCCIPMRSMFELAGIKSADIGSTIEAVRSQSHYRYTKLLKRVSNAATQHVRSLWHDYKSIRIDLTPDGELIVPLVTDHEVQLDMASRSDGFKRFVSFLLMISARVRTEEIKGVLILVDEPEIALHPSGAKSLAKELIKIGAANTVVYSTHSIFMIDKENVGRHLIVEKKKEVTTAVAAEKSKMQDEEVLYAAIGYSIFESLKLHNVIFEGWRDKEIFRVALEDLQKRDDSFREKTKNLGAVFAEGVKDIKHVSRILELASRKCLIISDSDKPALEKKKDYEDARAWGEWVTLKDILGEGFESGEDLFSLVALIRRANEFADSVGGLPHLALEEFAPKQSRWPIIQNWIVKSNLKGVKPDQQLHNFKNYLYRDLARGDLCDEVDQLAQYVAEYDFG